MERVVRERQWGVVVEQEQQWWWWWVVVVVVVVDHNLIPYVITYRAQYVTSHKT